MCGCLVKEFGIHEFDSKHALCLQTSLRRHLKLLAATHGVGSVRARGAYDPVVLPRARAAVTLLWHWPCLVATTFMIFHGVVQLLPADFVVEGSGSTSEFPIQRPGIVVEGKLSTPTFRNSEPQVAGFCGDLRSQ